jgi:hypothetical protein
MPFWGGNIIKERKKRKRAEKEEKGEIKDKINLKSKI